MSGKYHWSVHKNMPYIIVEETVIVDDLKKMSCSIFLLIITTNQSN